MENELIQKAVPIVLRQVDGRTEILLFDHPLAGTQLVKGSIETGESPEAAAVRELAEESGLTGVRKTIFLGDQKYPDIGQHWFFFECRLDQDLSESWEFFTEDDGGHLFRFHWRPIEAKITNPIGPVFDEARKFVYKRCDMIFIPETPEVDLDDMLRRYKTPRRRKKMTKTYTENLAVVAKYAKPQAMMLEFDRADVAELEEWLRPETVSVCLGLVTLGQELDEQVNKISAEDVLAGAVLNEVALAWIVALARQVREKAREGIGERPLKVGPGYRPGVGRWPLAEVQDVLFNKLPTADIGVTLDEYKIMKPSKSTSLVIPLRLVKSRPVSEPSSDFSESK